MSTRGNIGYVREDGKVEEIYSHWDSYPENNGRILRNHYVTFTQVKELVSLGAVSSLGEKIGEKHDFDKPPENTCNFYHRDRGEPWDDVKPRIHDTEDLFWASCDNDYTYLFKKGQWYFAHWQKKAKKLTAKDCKETETK